MTAILQRLDGITPSSYILHPLIHIYLFFTENEAAMLRLLYDPADPTAPPADPTALPAEPLADSTEPLADPTAPLAGLSGPSTKPQSSPKGKSPVGPPTKLQSTGKPLAAKPKAKKIQNEKQKIKNEQQKLTLAISQPLIFHILV